MDISGYWRPWKNGCYSKKLEKIWNQRTCKNWKGNIPILVCSLFLCVRVFIFSFLVCFEVNQFLNGDNEFNLQLGRNRHRLFFQLRPEHTESDCNTWHLNNSNYFEHSTFICTVQCLKWDLEDQRARAG